MTEKFVGLGYDQVLLVPGASNVLPHTVSVTADLGADFKLNVPLISEAFGPATDTRVVPMALNGGLGVVAEQADLAAQVEVVASAKEAYVSATAYPKALVDAQGRLRVGAEVWLTPGAGERVSALVGAGADAIFLYLQASLDDEAIALVQGLRADFPATFLAVGVIEAPEQAHALYEAGVDAVLAGRSVDSDLPNDVTYPFLTVTMGVAEVAADFDKATIAVGGVHYSGDIVKAVAAGADATMVNDLLKGSTLADDGTVTAGDLSIDDAIFQADGGLRAGMGYTGSASLAELKAGGRFVQITDNGLRESHPHDVEITKQAPNY